MTHWVVMGVSGCGKSTVAAALAERVGGEFLDADDFHPPENIRKMSVGIPLDDADRWAWLDALNLELRARSTGSRPVFLACSALREAHRQRLREGFSGLRFIYLRGSPECIAARLASRKGHFMSPALLETQFATLEEPSGEVTVDIDRPTADIIKEIESRMAFSKQPAGERGS